MGRPNYSFQKRQKDLAKKQKQDEKRQKKAERAKDEAGEGTPTPDSADAPAAPEESLP